MITGDFSKAVRPSQAASQPIETASTAIKGGSEALHYNSQMFDGLAQWSLWVSTGSAFGISSSLEKSKLWTEEAVWRRFLVAVTVVTLVVYMTATFAIPVDNKLHDDVHFTECTPITSFGGHSVQPERCTEFALGLEMSYTITDATLDAYLKKVNPPGYISLGFTTDAGRMMGSHAIIAWSDTDGGPHVGDYTLDGKVESMVTIQNRQNFTVLEAESVDDALTVHFQRRLQVAGIPWICAPQDMSCESTNIILAIGSTNSLSYHDNDRESVDFNFATSAGTEVLTAGVYEVWHGMFMAVGFGILLPMGVLLASFRNCLSSRWNINWFPLHLALNVTGVLCGVAGFVIAITQFYHEPSEASGLVRTHYNIGIALLVMCGFQVVGGVLHVIFQKLIPDTWRLSHQLVGIFGIHVLSVANIAIGMSLFDVSPVYWILLWVPMCGMITLSGTRRLYKYWMCLTGKEEFTKITSFQESGGGESKQTYTKGRDADDLTPMDDIR